MSIKVTLSEDAKRQIIFRACIDAKNKFEPDAIVEWEEEYRLKVSCYSKASIMKRKGLFRKKNVSEETTLEVRCIEVKIYSTEFNDLEWGEVRVKSFQKDYDELAEDIAHTLESYTPIVLIINNPTTVEALQNPSRR